MDKEVMRTYELFLNRYVYNDGSINQVFKYPYQSCGPTLETGLKGQKVMFCTSCKHNDHRCHIDYRTGYTIERREPRMEAYFEAENNVLLQKAAVKAI